MKPCSILIANFRGGEAMQLCIESILKRTRYDDYKIVVLDSSPEGDRDKQYLKSQRDKNNIELLESEKHISHGASLVKLIKYCDTEHACLLDSDCEILTGDWLSTLSVLLKEENDLGVAKLRTCWLGADYWWAPVYWACVLFLNIKLYREFEGEDDWSQINTTFDEYKYKHLFRDFKGKSKGNIISRDTAWLFTQKVLFETDNKYKMYPMPLNFWDIRIKHYGGISRNHSRPEHPLVAPRWKIIKENLNKLRNGK